MENRFLIVSLILVWVVAAIVAYSSLSEKTETVIGVCNKEFVVGQEYSINGEQYRLESMDIDDYSSFTSASLNFRGSK